MPYLPRNALQCLDRFVIAIFLALGLSAHAGGLTLTEAIKLTLQNSEEARLLNEKEVRLQAVRSEVLSGALPHLQGYANAGRASSPFDPSAMGIPAPMGKFTQSRYSYGVELSQPIYAFGRLGLAVRTASTQVESQNEANRRSRQELELQALDAFYGLVMAQSRLLVLEASGKRQKETVAFMESNFKMGAGMRSSVLLATASLKAVEPERIRAARNVEAARMALNRLLGRPIEDSLELDTITTAMGSPLVTSETAVETALKQRADLSALRLQKEALQGFAKGARMQYRPSLGFQGKLGILAFDPDQLGDFKNNKEWQVGVGLQWNLFDGFSSSSRARQYDSDVRSLELVERQASAFARIEIESAQREAEAADTAYQAARQARDAAFEALELLSDDFRAGKGQITDLLSAEEGLRNAEFGALASRYQMARSQAALRVALGFNLHEENAK